jgi:hypothetical protein
LQLARSTHCGLLRFLSLPPPVRLCCCRFDFQQLLVDLAGCEEAQIEQQQPQQLQALADAAFR